MARLQAQADQASYKKVGYSCMPSLQKRHATTKQKGETSITVRLRNERTALELSAGRSAE